MDWDCKIKHNWEIRKNIFNNFAKNPEMLHLQVPEGGKKVLLHCCCAPCSGAVVECMVQNGIKPALFFSNSNIVPYEEYVLRRSELERYARKFGLEVIDDEYDHQAWLDFVLERGIPGQARNDERGARNDERGARNDERGVRNDEGGAGTDESQAGAGERTLAEAPERGARCLNCFKFRLLRAAQYAAANGFNTLTTTLASSRWKSLEQVDEAGRWACGDVIWWNQNWRKGGLQPRRSEIIKEQCFYNQNYCGCEFSHKHESE
jgi:hypothetical protein